MEASSSLTLRVMISGCAAYSRTIRGRPSGFGTGVHPRAVWHRTVLSCAPSTAPSKIRIGDEWGEARFHRAAHVGKLTLKRYAIPNDSPILCRGRSQRGL